MPAAIDERIGRLIEARRNQEGLSQTDLGRLVGVGQSSIAAYETGERSIQMGRLADIARVLRVPVAALLPSEEQTIDARGLASLLNELDADDRGMLIQGLIAMLNVWRSRRGNGLAIVRDAATG